MQIITDEELDVLNQAILQRFGLDFYNYEKISFKRRVSRVIYKFELESIYDLWKKLLYEPGFITLFVNELTVGLTELFRNPHLWKYLKNEIIPKFKPRPPLRVWHAGCSTGEEVYTMSITLMEAHMLSLSQSLATDINSNALEKAQIGFFEQNVMAKYTQNYLDFTDLYKPLDYYYHQKENGIVFKNYLKEFVRFELGNLVQEGQDQEFDLIFCRNVLIYFDEVLKQKVLKRFHQCLADDGYLVLGYYDILPPSQENLFQMVAPAYKILQKSKEL